MNIKETFDDLVARHGIKHWSFAARKDQVFMDAVDMATKHLPDDLTFAERVYCAAHDFDPRCENNQRKKLVSIIKGWSFCGPAGKCACAREVISQKSRDNVDHEARLAKTRATLLERYGSDNPGQSPTARAAHKAFYADSTAVRAAVERGRATVETNDSYRGRREKAGLNATKRREDRLREMNSWYNGITPEGMIACAVCNRPCKMITEAHCKIHGITVSQYKERFSSPLVCEEVTASRIKTLTSIENVDRLKQHSFAAHTEAARDLLFDKDKLLSRIGTTSTSTIAREIGVDPETVRRYAINYGHTFDTSTSSFETEIAHFLSTTGISFRQRDRKIIAPKELDFYLPDHNLAIEFNGLYWHSDLVVSNDYHREKWQLCQNAGIRLLMINEDEWLGRSEVMKKKILNLCGQSQKGCGARKLIVRLVPNKQALDFIDLHHIQGRPATCSIALGAFWNDEMVAVVTLARQRGTNHLDLNRYCSDGRVFPGVFSKIMKALRSEVCEPIVTFADLRYSDGGLYEKCGFTNEGMIRPDYRYIKGRQTFHKSLFTKAQIAKKHGYDMTGKTESQAMQELGYSRIYDCGKIRYRLPPKE